MKVDWKNLRQWLMKRFSVELRTLGEFLIILAGMLVILFLEFGVNYWCKNNLTFVNPMMQGLPTYLGLAALILILGGKAGKIYAGIMLSLLILANLIGSLVLFKFKIEFGSDLCWVTISSSMEEIREFLGSYFGWWRVTGAALFFLAAVALLFWGIGKLKLQATCWTRGIGVLILLPFLICTIRYAFVSPWKMFSRTCMTRVIAGIYDFRQQWDSLLQTSRSPEIPAGLTVAPTEKPMLGVIVIGESATRSHHGVYGYSRQTTPELASHSDLIVFDDVISAWGSTTYALRLMLTMSTLDNPEKSRCSIVDLYKRCNFEVALYSNQFRWGEFDGPINLIFHAADPLVYLQERKRQAFDWELLPLLEPYWRGKGGKPQILFVHLIGSHHDAAGRYPSTWGPFNGRRDAANAGVSRDTATRINEYDNSIAYTDHLLGVLAKEIKKLDRPAFLLYLSDHGHVIDNHKDALRSSGNANPQIYEIPMVLLLNESYRKAFPEFYRNAVRNRHQPLQTDRMFWALAALGGIRCEAENSEKSNVFSPAYRPHPVRKVAAGKEIYRRKTESKR